MRRKLLLENDNKLYLYKNGNEHINVTGGWSQGGTDGVYNAPAGITKKETSIYVRSVVDYRITLTTNKMIDISDYNYLKIRCNFKSVPKSSVPANINLAISKNTSVYIEIAGGKAINIKEGGEFIDREFILDITDRIGEYYILINRAHEGYIELFEIWLER